jgi:hypothetical protein
MNGKFKGWGSLALHDRGLFAIFGEMIEGEPRTGQTATGSSGFCRRVHGFEHMPRPDGSQALALTFLATKDDRREWTLLQLMGGEIILLDAP